LRTFIIAEPRGGVRSRPPRCALVHKFRPTVVAVCAVNDDESEAEMAWDRLGLEMRRPESLVTIIGTQTKCPAYSICVWKKEIKKKGRAARCHTASTLDIRTRFLGQRAVRM